jgi:hypothetical protein
VNKAILNTNSAVKPTFHPKSILQRHRLEMTDLFDRDSIADGVQNFIALLIFKV